MLDTLDNILRVVTFIAVGGLVAIVFFFIFAQTITGSRTVHKQLEKLIRQNEEIARLLRQLKAESTKKTSEKERDS
jgi:uncharacterized membrane protein YjfL (UPF0719 family)